MPAAVTSSALETIDDYISDARTLLQDTISPYRYDDPSLIVAMNVTLLEGRRLRPDLFVYNKKCGPTGIPTIIGRDGTKIDIEAQFRLAFLHGLVAHALERDQEDIQDERASVFMQIFNTLLIGRGSIAPKKQQEAG